MDELLVLASELAENNNYKNDSFSGDNKPDGDYVVAIEKITMKTSQTGNEYFSFVLKVMEGDYADEKFYVNFHMTPKTIKSTVSKIMRLIDALGFEIDRTMFNDKETLLEGLQNLIGKETILTKATKGEFINYSFKGEE